MVRPQSWGRSCFRLWRWRLWRWRHVRLVALAPQPPEPGRGNGSHIRDIALELALARAVQCLATPRTSDKRPSKGEHHEKMGMRLRHREPHLR